MPSGPSLNGDLMEVGEAALKVPSSPSSGLAWEMLVFYLERLDRFPHATSPTSLARIPTPWDRY